MSTYYVSVNGNDGNRGTVNSPFSTIRKAFNVLKPGDTVYVREGTYYQDRSLWLGDKHSGTASNRTVIKAYPGENVTIDGWDQSSGNLINIEGDYIDIDGFRMKNSPGHGIGVWGGDHVRIKGNVIHEAKRGGITAHGQVNNGREDRVKHLLVDGNTIYRTNLANQSRSSTSGWDSGVNASRANNVSIRNNRVYNNYGEGISLTLSTDSVVADNVTHDNFSVELYLDNVRNSIVERNFTHNTGNAAYFRKICSNDGCKWLPASGIQLANEDYGTSAYSLNNNVLRNNIIVDTRNGFSYDSYQTSRGMKNILVANNTFYGAEMETLHVDSDDDNRNVTFANNIFDQGNDPLDFYLPSRTGLNFKNNLLNDNDRGASRRQTLSSSDVVANPLFIRAGGTKAADYKLRSGSRAINAGTYVDSLINDFFKGRRPLGGKFDIGAFEAGTGGQGGRTGTAGDDTLKGGNGNDVLSGRGGNDRIYGYKGNDKLIGNEGNDKLSGAHGADSLYGSGGADTLMGASSNSNSKNTVDILTGGSGRDRFIVGNQMAVFYNKGLKKAGTGLQDYARITDFNKNYDSIQLKGSARSYVLRGTSPIRSVSGNALYFDHNRNGFDSTDELIAIVQTSQQLNLSASYFSFV